jgi:phage tail protein X
VDKYQTMQGDTWDIIAKKRLGNEKLMSLLMEANPAHLQTVIFPAGIELDVPSVPTPSPSNLPPWKRGGTS